ncbi:MAG: hypothetical protein QM796_14845 [Chthoniobacteraceae bacterium]
MADPNEQAQSQSQSVNISVSLDSSSDPDLERHIFAKVSSVGRQLGRISEVLELLLNAYEQGRPEASQDEAIVAFREMQQKIEAEKSERTQKRIKAALKELQDSASLLSVEDAGTLKALVDSLQFSKKGQVGAPAGQPQH